MSDERRSFLLLQGPHGPFFRQLAKMLCLAGAEVWRIGFNAGDRAFWNPGGRYIAFDRPFAEWPDFISRSLRERTITDIVLYGDTRPIHALAIEQARRLGLRIHVFEEGYLRPYWITYERDGANGNSRLMNLGVREMRDLLEQSDAPAPEAPATWGDMRQHVFYGALYHWFVLCMNRRYRNFLSHRQLTVGQEFRLYLRKLLLMPATAADRFLATRRVKTGGFPYHLALLQLEHDASFRGHSRFNRMSEFLELVIAGFAKGAPRHHHLVLKAHPLEDGRASLHRNIRRLARDHGVAERIHYLSGGKLAPLLDHAKSAITVNSTAGQQALWRGIPLKTLGDAVYGKPEFTSDQSVAEFFRNPSKPDIDLYRCYRQFLLETSQVTGGFYSGRGRRQVLRLVVDRMLAPESPYDFAARPGGGGGDAARQRLRVIR